MTPQHFHLADEVIVLGHGQIQEQGKWDQLKSRGRSQQMNKIIHVDSGAKSVEMATAKSMEISKRQQQTQLEVALDITRYYLNATGWGNFFLLVACTVLYSFFITIPQYWLKLWTESDQNQEWLFIGGYVILNFSAWVSTNGISCAPLSFFSKTESGSIINRFGQDLQLADRKLPLAISTMSVPVGVIALAVVLKDTTTGGQIGVALNMVLVVNATLLRLVESWTNLEISLGAIARLKRLEAEVPSENEAQETSTPPETWPSEGTVKVDGLTAAYGTNNVVLRDISLTIAAGQKVVLCGRTGSEALSTDTILSVLNKVHTRQYFSSEYHRDVVPSNGDPPPTSHHPVLDRQLTSLPPLSGGQAQLVALGRALLQVHAINASGAQPVVLLDEATAALDHETEALILNIIHEELTCKGYTAILVAHRLSTAVSNMRDGVDTVVLMADGRIQKLGSVKEVLGNESKNGSELSKE
ncbi:putative multidrug resistance protein [Eutypa lata UCREL1]|uniref:Putative multidrug resistance protein n=1 Tax=Eutypa lata (strain UCR-EL1) TaxID=1287681 RepID=M7T0C6_EUTLA|nr:putative multidrug resistance protein [Eutypa lata UCREL1]